MPEIIFPEEQEERVDFESVPPGTYLCEIEEVEEVEGGKAGYFRWELRILEGEYKGRMIFTITSFSPNALWKLRQLLHALGCRIEAGKKYHLEPQMFIGKKVRVKTYLEQYEGRDYTRVKRFISVGEKVELGKVKKKEDFPF